jgi:hypothetical protein
MGERGLFAEKVALLFVQLMSVLTQRIHGVVPSYFDWNWKGREYANNLFFFEQI